MVRNVAKLARDRSIPRTKVSLGSFTLLKEHPSIPDGPVEFFGFRVNGEEVEVSHYVDADLTSESTMSRREARVIWRNALQRGFRED